MEYAFEKRSEYTFKRGDSGVQALFRTQRSMASLEENVRNFFVCLFLGFLSFGAEVEALLMEGPSSHHARVSITEIS